MDISLGSLQVGSGGGGAYKRQFSGLVSLDKGGPFL